jgi:hypothetical protein
MVHFPKNSALMTLQSCALTLSCSLPSKSLFQRLSLPALVLWGRYRSGPSCGSFWGHSLPGNRHTSEPAQIGYAERRETYSEDTDWGPSRLQGDSVGLTAF